MELVTEDHLGDPDKLIKSSEKFIIEDTNQYARKVGTFFP
jgi:hypothetical protein